MSKSTFPRWQRWRPASRGKSATLWTSMSWKMAANQALSAEYMNQNAKTLEKNVYGVPQEIDTEIARLKLLSLGVGIDTLTEEQERYLASWQEGI